MRSYLKEPLGVLLEGGPEEIAKQLGEILRCKKPKLFASVGDISSGNIVEMGIQPDIIVIDHRVMRAEVEPMSLCNRTAIRARNPPGTINIEAWRALEKAVRLKRSVTVIVEGEEDLLVLPLIELMPVGSLITYGQPQEGMVVVDVTEERKRWAQGIMIQMEKTKNGDRADLN